MTHEFRIYAMCALISLHISTAQANDQGYQGQYTINPYAPNSTMHPNGADNPYGGDHDSPKIYDSQGNYRGNLNSNPYDPNSISNPYGRYGSEYSPDSINNPYGAGSPYNQDSPYNPYGQGMEIHE